MVMSCYKTALYKTAPYCTQQYHGQNEIQTWHDDVMKWKHFPRYWPFVRAIHWPPVDSRHKGQWRGALMFLWFVPEQMVEQTIETPVIETPSVSLWRHNGQSQSSPSRASYGVSIVWLWVWASYQIRKIASCACAGMPGTFSPPPT